MKTRTPLQHEESTYALLMRSEQEERSLPECAAYLLLIACAALIFCQAALTPFRIPRIGLLQEGPIAKVAEGPTHPRSND